MRITTDCKNVKENNLGRIHCFYVPDFIVKQMFKEKLKKNRCLIVIIHCRVL
jgi:hypothetical protein